MKPAPDFDRQAVYQTLCEMTALIDQAKEARSAPAGAP